MTRPVRTGLLLLAASLLAGCATTLPRGPEPAEDGAPSADPGRFSTARTDYFRGVRAFVRDDLGEAREAMHRCQEGLYLASLEETLDERSLRDVETLLSKADYFLQKIEELQLAGLDERPVGEGPGGGATAPAASEEPTWEVVHGSISPVRNRDVDRWIRYFTGDGREVFQRWLDRKSRYLPTYQEVFARHGLPPELAYHSMIESGFSPGAYSWAHAVGLWQFIRATGRKYGLRADWWVDERRDPAKSTEAAALYLKDLYEEFEDWELALAAYNVGEAKIRRQMRRQKTRDFWKLRLPRETRNHVPKFYAALILGSEPEKHGFAVKSPPPPETDTIRVDFSVDFDVLGEICGVSPTTLAELNPALIRRCTPSDPDGYPVLVPAGTGERAQEALASLPEEKRVRWAHHRVRRGETLSHIANRYRTSVRAIAEANRLRSVNLLSVGQDLLIPKGRRTVGAPPKFAARDPGPSGSRKITYVVKRGDTLSEIAERYRTSARQLRRWNRVGKFIFPGQRLTIWTRGGKSSGSRDFVVKVRKGDTLWDIARHHGVSLSALLRANNLSRKSLIRPGDRIRVPRS